VLEDDEDAEVLVRGEAMLGASLYENSGALSHGNFLALDLEYACPLEDNVELVITVGLLSVGLWGYEAIDPDFEAGGLVNDLVATADPSQSLLDGCDFE
jgi:hypothetical protein